MATTSKGTLFELKLERADYHCQQNERYFFAELNGIKFAILNRAKRKSSDDITFDLKDHHVIVLSPLEGRNVTVQGKIVVLLGTIIAQERISIYSWIRPSDRFLQSYNLGGRTESHTLVIGVDSQDRFTIPDPRRILVDKQKRIYEAFLEAQRSEYLGDMLNGLMCIHDAITDPASTNAITPASLFSTAKFWGIPDLVRR